MEPYYSAQDIVGVSLFPNYTIGLKRLPFDNAPTFFNVNQGSTVGTVYSYLVPGTDRKNLYWMFLDSNGKAYYAEHVPGRFSIQALQQQGVLTAMDKILADKLKNETIPEKIERNMKWIVGGILTVSLIVGLSKAYLSNRK